ncbi:hypothetical protein HETIRDRAFT_411199 [Heterobasidion irregulare TC 32-1]|uniref:Uncharacterized protein n=1 Tax=Heterobasidion irregulare (strain TC 32-1) TaxID=747525 RepID=W4JWY4_HETIT|nr:uncharacterized protein HETIRDRAFT_411199 [Heterobasidion irregulare TC 32-1]ETW77969.1 hypothetical protein HETIRDRAFT_411199 [Heterobasidion irregulare TC 32-1]
MGRYNYKSCHGIVHADIDQSSVAHGLWTKMGTPSPARPGKLVMVPDCYVDSSIAIGT